MERLSVPDAAEKLGLSAQRVRQLIHAGDLEARQLAGRWLVDANSLERLANHDRPAGRPWSPARAWGLLALAAHRPADWLSNPDRDRLERVLAKRGLHGHIWQLSQRAARQQWYIHPGLVDRLLAEQSVVIGGAKASGKLRDSGPVEVYVHPEAVDELVAKYAPDDKADEPNIIVRVVRGPWPFSPGEQQAWPLVAAVDLLERGDNSRARQVAEELLDAYTLSCHRP